MRVTNLKNCYCYTCKKDFHYLGIARHRRAHKEKKEDCEIMYTNGDVYIYRNAPVIIIDGSKCVLCNEDIGSSLIKHPSDIYSACYFKTGLAMKAIYYNLIRKEKR